MIALLKTVLGLFTGSAASKVAGGINLTSLAVMAPLGYWFYDHRLDTIAFEYQQLFVFALIIFGYVEMNRRQTPPSIYREGA